MVETTETGIPAKSNALTKMAMANGEWRNTEALSVDDLLVAAKLLDHSHSWIVEAMQADRRPARVPTRKLGQEGIIQRRSGHPREYIFLSPEVLTDPPACDGANGGNFDRQ